MIHIERKAPPAGLNSPTVAKARKEAAAFFRLPPERRRQKNHKFFPLSTKLKDFREGLERTFAGKCAFCESLITEADYSYMDRFRPTCNAIGLDGQTSPQHYWWLAYEWTNIYMACFICNKVRGNRFPIKGRRAAEEASGSELLAERRLLLDPCEDRPETLLVFDERGMVASSDERGRMTIEAFGLNRLPLVEARREALAAQREMWESAFARGSSLKPGSAEFFRQLDDERLPYRAMRRQFLQQWSGEKAAASPALHKRLDQFLFCETALTAARMETAGQASLKQAKASVKKTFDGFKHFQEVHEKFSVERETKKSSYYMKTRLVERLEIRNFKAIDSLDLAFSPGEQEHGAWMLLLGENGTGKSSILHALALALMGERERRRLMEELGLRASEFVRYGARKGYIKVYLMGTPDPVELHFDARSHNFRATPKEPKVLLLGYGATRLLPRESKSGRPAAKAAAAGAARADNLFDPSVPLGDAESWLCSLKEAEFDSMAGGLKRLLLLDETAQELVRRCDRKKDRVLVRGYRRRTPLYDLSAGYQSVVALTADIMSVMRHRWGSMQEAEGLVIIDEIDAHLHPRWRMQIVPRLRHAFPRLQFVVTSHDPLCLRGLHAGEVAVMKRDASDRQQRPLAITDLPSPDSMRVDQLLTSEFFGLNSTVDPDLDKLFTRYYELLAVRAPSERQKREIEELRGQLKDRHQLGLTRREQVVLEAADKFIAERDSTADKRKRADLKAETKKAIADMWATAEPLVGGGAS